MKFYLILSVSPNLHDLIVYILFPRDSPGFDSQLQRCNYRASRPLQGTVNGGAVSKNDLAVDGT